MTNAIRLSSSLGLATLAVLFVAELPEIISAIARLPILACKMAEMIAGFWS